MAISTNGAIITRLAGALYGEYLSNASYVEVSTTAPTTVATNWLSNDFSGKTDLQLANTILTNLGLTSIAGLNNWLSAQLTAAGSTAAAKGAKLVSILNDYSQMTADVTYGSYAVSFNAKTDASLVKSQTTAAKGGSFLTADVVAITNATLPLTAGVDTTLVGGAGSDTYTATNATLTAGDSMDGGAGTDTLSLTSILGGTYGAGARSTGVENLSVTATIGDATVDASGLVGLTKITSVGSTQAVTVTGLTTIPSLELTGSSNSLTATMAAAAVIGGADSISIALNGAGTTASSAAIVSANGIETINVTSSGSASGSSTSTVAINSDVLTTLNVTGAVAAKLSANLFGATALITGTVTSDDGAHDVAITADATDKLSVSMGAGNDTVRVANVAALYTIAGGDGTDTLRYTGDTAVTLAATANVSGFETVTLSSTVANTSFAMTGAGVSTVNYTTAGAGTFGGLSTGGTVNLNVGGTVVAAAAGAAATATAAATTTAATYSGTADSLTVNVGLATTTTGAAASTVSAIGVESVTFNSLTAAGGSEARTVTFGDTTATTGATKSITVNSSGTGTITAAFSPTGTSALTSVNLAGVTGNAVFASGTTLVGVAITGGTANDTLTGGAAADTILGGEGNDVLDGGAGADSIDGGNGANSITGGAGADNLTGGTGVDTYVFASNATTAATPVLTSTLSAPDTISNFTSGVDKISITGAYAPVAFLGNFVNIQAALSAQGNGDNIAYRAAFVSGENSLYVFQNTGGTLHVNDMVIKMTGVTALATTGSDLLLGSQGTGNGITLNLAAANVTSSTSLNATETTAAANTPSGSANTTSLNDTVTTRVDFLVGSTVSAGVGTDTLALSNNVAFAQANVAIPATVTGFETITLANYTPATSTANNRYYDITLDAAIVPTNTTLTVTSSEDGLSFDGSMITSGVIFTASNLAASQPLNFTGAGAQDSVTGGAGNDTISGGDGNDTLKAGTGTNSVTGNAGDDSITSASLTDVIDGGAGNDTVIALTGAYTGTLAGGAGVADILQVIASTDIKGGTVSGFETLAIVSADVASSYGMTAAQLSAFTSITTTTVAAANNTIAIDASTTAKATGTITLDVDVIKYTVTGAAGVAGVTINGPATTAAFSVTGGVGDDNISLSAATGAAAETLIGGNGNDTITVSAAATTGGTDTIIFGTDAVASAVAASIAGTLAATADTLILSGILASTITATLTNVHDVDVITVSGITTGAVALTSADVNTSATLTTVVTTSQTTGAFTFNGVAELDGKLSVTGGGGDDVLTGGTLADTLSGGAGADTLDGGAGADTITSGAGNNNITGGIGNDVIDLTGGGSDVLVYGASSVRTLVAVPFTDTVTGFGVTLDRINISAGDLDGEATAALTLSDTGGSDLGAKGFLTSLEVAANTNIGSVGLGAKDMIKFTSTTSTSFASAIGTATITLNHATDMAVAVNAAATEGVLAIYYNATNSQAVVGILYNVVAGAAVAVFTDIDTFQPIALVGMSAADYATFTFTNFATV